ncbi:hypothetical protein [Variovorax sp. YR216]|uniref:KfrB domain-containing protein n=1 Tax=Variovorax sp. YR216 TaxID=1882828 RepID=UPI000895F41C|nr:hypothetical protein [Variovorax sp. YR216]SEB26336.1 hypothetical protein SAMN05444680_13130 [Variovorax sp. YR216]
MANQHNASAVSASVDASSKPTWTGGWEVSTDGRYEVRPVARQSTEGFIAGYESSWRGGEGPVVYAGPPHASLPEAQKAAESHIYERLREHDTPLQHYPEVGKTYRGTVISITDADLVMAVEGQHIRHERRELSGPQGLLSPGAKVEIRYPANRVGILREWGAMEMRTGTSKGREPKGFG